MSSHDTRTRPYPRLDDLLGQPVTLLRGYEEEAEEALVLLRAAAPPRSFSELLRPIDWTAQTMRYRNDVARAIRLSRRTVK